MDRFRRYPRCPVCDMPMNLLSMMSNTIGKFICPQCHGCCGGMDGSAPVFVDIRTMQAVEPPMESTRFD